MTLQIATVLTLTLVALTSAGHEPRGKCITYGGNYHCPAYTLGSDSDSDIYEERVYEEAKWVKTHMTDSSGAAFWRLYGYISGNNTAGDKIPMTAPVIKSHTLENEEVSTATHMFFYLNVEDPPQPTEPNVEIITSKQFTAYVRSYGLYSIMARVQSNVDKVLDELDSATDLKSVYVAGYDSPYTPLNRHNEVWLTVGNIEA